MHFKLLLYALRFTYKAIISVYTNNIAAFSASPSSFLIPQEFFHTVLLNILKIFNHAHVIFCSVSFIQLFQSSAWKFITFILFIDTLAERPYIYRLTLFIYLEYSSPNILIHHLSSDSIIQWEDIWKTINNVNNVHELDISAHPNKQMKYAMYIGLRDIRYKPFTFIP